MNIIHIDKLEVQKYSGVGLGTQHGVFFDACRSIQIDYLHLENLNTGIEFANTPVDINVKGGYLGKAGIANDVVGTGTRCYVENMDLWRTYNQDVEAGFAVDAVAMVSSVVAHGLDVTPNNIRLTLKRANAVNDYGVGFLRYHTVGAANFTIDVDVVIASATGGATVDVDWEADGRQV
jgi:hypothetical protein